MISLSRWLWASHSLRFIVNFAAPVKSPISATITAFRPL